MKKIYLFFSIIFLATSCTTLTTKAWNVPFLNSEDIVQLDFGMTKNNVLEVMPGPPLYVESGDSETTVWVYKVRTIKVKSTNHNDGTVTPEKTNRGISGAIQHQNEIDVLYFTFDVQNRLLAWGAHPYDPNFIAPYYDCAGECNGDAYIDDCGNCNVTVIQEEDEDEEQGSFKLQLNVEGTQEPDGTLIIEGGN